MNLISKQWIHKGFWVVMLVLGAVAVLSTCRQTNSDGTQATAYWNHGDSVHYVGIETCASCHQDIYKTFIQTGMGQSYDRAHPEKSKSDFTNHPPVYDADLDFYYQGFWKNDNLFIREFRLQDGDTVHQIVQRIDDIIGSGQHTNSHIFSLNDHYYQAPLTWYVQKGQPDLPPGYEAGASSRFSRIIGLECMSCHNAMPTGFVKGSENKFTHIPKGIDCERCHGPGSAHVAKIQRGEITDTANAIDPSIVNPAKLSPQLQFEICQRCHLQGNAVLAEGATFFDFLPGKKLTDVMDVYTPRYAGDSSSFIMASHVDRFKMSKCYQSAPESFVCTSCHNPHISVKHTGSKVFNRSCQNCHKGTEDVCSTPEADRLAVENNCVKCHMPPSGSSDIPHVFVHDHFIRKDYSDTVKKSRSERIFAGLVAINNPNPDLHSRIKAYLQQYERFESGEFLLDSAFVLLNRAGMNRFPHEWIQYYFLKTNFRGVVGFMERNFSHLIDSLSEKRFDNKHAWTAYRIAESYNQLGKIPKAELYIQRAISLAPHHPDFLQKAAVIAIKQERFGVADSIYMSLSEVNPYDPAIYNNRGYLLQVQGQHSEAMAMYQRAISFDPDYLPAYVKIAGIYAQRHEMNLAIDWMEKAVKMAPENPQLREQLTWLKQQN
ncbi:MAG: hypothetical protein JJU02_06275 [Cryomorphaceae bacterium]|nr:hypothetical protein [Cryomorphaceae bacterium]